jgi:hypothetical protein
LTIEGVGLGGFLEPLIIAKLVDFRDAVDLRVLAAAAPPADRPRVPDVVGTATLLVDFIVPDIVPRLDCRISKVAYPFSSMLGASSNLCCLAWSKKVERKHWKKVLRKVGKKTSMLQI